MKVLTAKGWQDGVLDETIHACTVRVQVRAWFRHRKVSGVYFERSASIGGLIGYYKKVGMRDVFRKIVSRLSERNRNSRFISTGIGTIVSAGKDSNFNEGDIVSFVAPNHPRAMSRIVLDDRLVRKAKLKESQLAQEYSDQDVCIENLDVHLNSIQGWHLYSGWPVENLAVDKLCAKTLEIETSASAIPKPTSIEEISTRRRSTANENSTKPTASLFGYGNHAKTLIIPSISKLFNVNHIHEIDPLQMGRSPSITWDTSPNFSDDEKPSVCFVAGYHHTHAQNAIEALKRGAKTMVEKPTCTTWEQLQQFREALERYAPQVYAGFHRRYSNFNPMLAEDLEIQPGDPVNYHCIVFEEPLPRFHWYGWPNSRTRITSNGCHWIDHFMFLNDFSKIVKHSIMSQSRGTVLIGLEAENGAGFSMTLTDEGSARQGVQDHVQFRLRGRTATIDSERTYVSESENRVLRRASVSGLKARRDMYKIVGQKMLDDEPGETDSLFAAAEICLKLEEEFRAENSE